MAHFSIQFIIIVTHSLLQLIEAASLDDITATIINIVSITLQVTALQLTSDSFQSNNIAAIKLDIQVDINDNLINLIALFILCYYYRLYDCVHYKQHEHLEKINEKPEHYVVKTSIITEESVKPSTIK